MSSVHPQIWAMESDFSARLQIYGLEESQIGSIWNNLLRKRNNTTRDRGPARYSYVLRGLFIDSCVKFTGASTGEDQSINMLALRAVSAVTLMPNGPISIRGISSERAVILGAVSDDFLPPAIDGSQLTQPEDIEAWLRWQTRQDFT